LRGGRDEKSNQLFTGNRLYGGDIAGIGEESGDQVLDSLEQKL